MKYITLCAFAERCGSVLWEEENRRKENMRISEKKSSNDVRKMDSLSLCVSFHQQTGLKFKEETSEVLHLEYNILVLKLGHF